MALWPDFITAKERRATLEETGYFNCFALDQVFNLHLKDLDIELGVTSVISERTLICQNVNPPSPAHEQISRREKEICRQKEKMSQSCLHSLHGRDVSAVNTREGNIVSAQKTLFRTK